MQECGKQLQHLLAEESLLQLGLPSIIPLDDPSSFRLDAGTDSIELSCRLAASASYLGAPLSL